RAEGVSDRRQHQRLRARRPRCELLRELRVHLDQELHRLLQRAGDEADRSAITGAGSEEALRPRPADSPEARGGGGAAHDGLALRLSRAVAVRAEPRASPLPLHLRPDAGGLARQVGRRASRIRPSAGYPLKLIFLWLPSQRGFLPEAPQRQRYAASPLTGTGLPCGSNTSMPSPLTMRGPSGSGLTTTAIRVSFSGLGARADA